MPSRRNNEPSPAVPIIRLAPLGELNVYMVMEEELEAIGRGSPGSIFLNFALALLPLSASFLMTLLVTSINSIGMLIFFVSAFIICLIAGILCAVLAWRYHASVAQVVEKIKNRMPPPPPINQETAPPIND